MRAILLLYLFVFSFLLSEAHSFQSVSLERGMLQSHVLCMHKDKQGYLWFGTFNGLHRFDGKNFLYFLADDKDSTSISNRGVHAIFENEDSTMWIGTKNGLNLYDPKTNRFTVFDDFPCNEIRSIDKTDDGLLWLGTYGGGVCSFDVNSNEIKSYTYCHNLGSPVKYVNKILVSRDDEIWVGTEGTGLLKLAPFSKDFSQIKLDTDTLITVMSIKENAYGELWLATWGNGAFKFNPESSTVTNYTKKNTATFSSDVIRDIEIDSRGRVWLATQKGLVNFEGGGWIGKFINMTT